MIGQVVAVCEQMVGFSGHTDACCGHVVVVTGHMV
jgi:hypothetical protein